MGTTLNRHAYQRLIDENLEWLLKQPRTLERDHIEAIVRLSPSREYDQRCDLCHEPLAFCRCRTIGRITIDRETETETFERTTELPSPARVTAPIVAPVVDHEVEQSNTETMGRLYTDASVVVDNLSTDLSTLRSENRLMQPVVDAAIAYTVEFKTGMTDEALQQLAIAVNAYKESRSAPASPAALRDEAAISPLGYEHAITIGWDQHNARRHKLIEAKRSRLLSETEIAELAELQWLAGIKRELADGPVAIRDEAEPQWTKEPPKVDGVYWWRLTENDPDPDICETDLQYGTVYDIGEPQGDKITERGGEWLGPIVPEAPTIIPTIDRTPRFRVTPAHPFGPCGYKYCDWPDGELRCNEPRATTPPSTLAKAAAEEIWQWINDDSRQSPSDDEIAAIIERCLSAGSES